MPSFNTVLQYSSITIISVSSCNTDYVYMHKMFQFSPLIPKKDNYSTELFTWLMKMNILLIFLLNVAANTPPQLRCIVQIRCLCVQTMLLKLKNATFEKKEGIRPISKQNILFT